MISIRNLLYIKLNRHRPQYQYNICWMKFEIFREYIEHFNISPTPDRRERSAFYQFMLESAKLFKEKFLKWSKSENEKRVKINEAKKNNKPIKLIDTNFLKNPDILKSKFIYNIFLEDYARKNHSNLLNINYKKEEQIFLSLNKLNSSNIRLVNYKLI